VSGITADCQDGLGGTFTYSFEPSTVFNGGGTTLVCGHKVMVTFDVTCGSTVVSFLFLAQGTLCYDVMNSHALPLS
jgi:hypothetical protein